MNEWLALWQERLRLSDWETKVSLASKREMRLDGSEGTALMTPSKKRALIQVLDARDYPEDEGFDYDPERVIVHELLHLHIAPFFTADEDSKEHMLMEQAVHSLSLAFVGLMRKGAA